MEKYFLFGLIFLGILLIVCFVVIYKLYKKVNVLQKYFNFVQSMIQFQKGIMNLSKFFAEGIKWTYVNNVYIIRMMRNGKAIPAM